ncbi:MAG: acyltransferase [Nitrososphaerales archaeon]
MGPKARIQHHVTVSTYETSEESILRVGEKSEIFTQCTIDCSRAIEIGNNVGIGGRAMLFTHGGWEIGGHATKFGSINIKDCAWLAWGVTVLPGVTIGEGSVVGSCSVVTKDVLDYSIVAGNPARFKRMRRQDEVPPEYWKSWEVAQAKAMESANH